MEVIWHILLTVCLRSACVDQDVQWFDDKEQCFKMLDVYKGMPIDGDWDTVVYQCRPINSLST